MGSFGLAANECSDGDRRRLLDAAFAFAETGELATLDLVALSRRAGISEEATACCFSSQASLIEALHREFRDRVVAEMTWHMGAVPPGLERFQNGVCAFLDYCLQHASLRRQLLDLEITLPALAPLAESRRSGLRLMLGMQLSALGLTNHLELARMLRVLIDQLSLVEIEEGSAQPALREEIWNFVRPPKRWKAA